MTWFGGIDVGSVATKMVIINKGEIVYFYTAPSGSDFYKASNYALSEILKISNLKLSEISGIVATGCGAQRVSFAVKEASDLICCAKGSHKLFPEVRTIIEVGGQATKVIRVNDKGKIVNFVVSERCAAGSGRFLQVIAKVLQVSLDEAANLSLKSNNPVGFTTSCAVFGESEAISRVAEGTPKQDIIAGVHQALATKISTLADRISLEEPCVIAGGGALDAGLIKRTEDVLGLKLLRPDHPEIITALGAALLGTSINN